MPNLSKSHVSHRQVVLSLDEVKAALDGVANILKLENRDHYLGLVIRMVLAGIKHYNL